MQVRLKRYAKCIPVILTYSVELIRLELYRYLRFTACVVEVLSVELARSTDIFILFPFVSLQEVYCSFLYTPTQVLQEKLV